MKRVFCLLILLSLLLCGCAGEKKYETTIFAMDTVMNLQIWGEEAESAANRISAILRTHEQTWSTTQYDSVISRLNRGEAEPAPEQQLILDRAEELSQRTDGAFDPRLRALSEAWGFYGSANQDENFEIPTQDKISAAIAAREWDLGAVLKGYAGQEAAELLRSFNVDRAILNLGGNTQTYGEKPDGAPWIIGIQDPNGGDSIGTVSVTGTMSIVTSGDYQRYFEKDGATYHHILDPETGYPADSGLRSVTIICRDGMTADALSTALFVMGLEEAAEFWRASDDFEAVFILKDGSIYATEGANLSGCEYEVITR